VLYVGIPEESVKLALFSLFIPVLLRRRSASRAALTAGCVGLGFAFDENLGYYLHEGGHAAIGRFITANFLHIAWTGIAGCALYDLCRSRFHRATEFLAAFLGVCAAHGIYDFASTPSAQFLGVDLAGIIVIVVMARMYFDRLRPDDGELRSRTVSATAVFCLGCALLVAATIVVTVWQMNSMRGATQALKSVVSVFPVALIYGREFREL
jgi:RsiW-degrading membrane proteinase PrsW (M82 family)